MEILIFTSLIFLILLFFFSTRGLLRQKIRSDAPTAYYFAFHIAEVILFVHRMQAILSFIF